MTETRRDLFKTSVLSTLSGFIAGGVAGVASADSAPARCPSPPDPPNPRSVIAVHDNQRKIWYLFRFEDSDRCRLYSTCTSCLLDETKADTATWFLVANSTLVTEDMTILYKQSDGTPGEIAVKLDNEYYLTPITNKKLESLVSSGTRGTQVGGSWNEIGKG